MDVSRRRSSPANVVAGSVWESRMKMDDVKGGFKFFNGEEEDEDMNPGAGLSNKSAGIVREKRKTWKPEPFEVIGGYPIQVRKSRSDVFSKSFHGIEKNPRSRSLFHGLDLDEDGFVDDEGEEETVMEKEIEPMDKKSFDVKQVEKPIPIWANVKFLTPEVDISEQNSVIEEKEFDQAFEKPIPIVVNVKKQTPETDKPKKVVKEEKRKTWKAEPLEAIGSNPIHVRKSRSDLHRFLNKSVDGAEKKPIYIKKTKSLFHRNRKLDVHGDDFDDDDEEEKAVEKDIEQMEKKNFCFNEVEKPIPISSNAKKLIAKVDISEHKPKKVVKEEKKQDQVLENPRPISPIVKKLTPQIEMSEQKPNKVVKEEKKHDQLLEKPRPISPIVTKLTPEVDILEQKPKKIVKEENGFNQLLEIPIPISANVKRLITEVDISEQKPKKVVEDRRLNQVLEKPMPISTNTKKQGTEVDIAEQKVVKRQSVSLKNHLVTEQESFRSPPKFERFPQTQNKFQNIVDLVMWRDVSKSAFVFGLGTFILIASSCTKDLNISLISAISYLGLLCLAAIFLYKSVLCRKVMEIDDSTEVHLVGEEEAIWLLKLFLPYLNEFLLKLRALFSGDPAITMKLAVLLFVVGQYGSSITTLKIVKFGFLGVFTLPKVCSSYSIQLTTYTSSEEPDPNKEPNEDQRWRDLNQSPFIIIKPCKVQTTTKQANCLRTLGIAALTRRPYSLPLLPPCGISLQ